MTAELLLVFLVGVGVVLLFPAFDRWRARRAWRQAREEAIQRMVSLHGWKRNADGTVSPPPPPPPQPAFLEEQRRKRTRRP